ncbi:MAG: glyceraldehyde-3-phosphate dehydrogenase [Chitinophagales bacterium]|nr:glyceraldehyde-3-phosphate dehydrogenase [Chitinophagales bacterium]
MNTNFTKELNSWIENEKNALALINAASELSLSKSVELVLFRRKINDQKVSEVLSHHEYGKNFANIPLTVGITREIAEIMCTLDLAPARIDIGRLAKEWVNEGKNYASMASFLEEKLAALIGTEKCILKPKDVVLYGFGRIGRLAARLLTEQIGKGDQLRLKAIVVRKNGKDDIDKRASLLRVDSVHGPLAGTVNIDHENERLIVNGNAIQMIYANHPSEIDYTKYGINDALIIDNMGIWKTREDLGQHLQAKGAKEVLLTAPASGDLLNIVYGVNENDLGDVSDNIYSAASCTTNAVAPVLKRLDDVYGILDGHLETVHAYTNDQNLIDNFHKKGRRGRSAPLNMVLTETGAAKAVFKIMPHLKGKLTANAVRVPTPNVSLAILSISLSQSTSVEEVNELFRKASLEGALVEQIDYSISPEHVSSDVVGSTAATVIDSTNTIVSDNGKRVVVYAWYDNEHGYTCQVIRMAKYIAKVRRLTYY